MDITDIEVSEDEVMPEEESKEIVVQRRIEPVVEKMQQLEVTNDEQFTIAGQWLKKSKDTQKFVEEKFGPEVEAAKEKKRQAEAERKAAMEKIEQFTSPLKKADAAVRRMIATYQTEQEKKQREAEKKRREEAEKKRKEEEAKRAETGDTTPVEEPVQEPVPEKKEEPKVEGVSFYEHWDFEIEDENAIPRQFLSIDEKKIRKYVQAMKGDAEIPGVRVYMEKKPRVR